LERLHSRKYDVLFPVHDEVFVLARFQDRFRGIVSLPVSAFAVLDRVQSKAGFLEVLDELRLPHPATVLVRTRSELERAADCPCYIKLVYGTAGRGVWFAPTTTARLRLAESLEQMGLLDGRNTVLVQQPARGVLEVAQSVFRHGELVAAHSYQARGHPGVGGSAWARVGVQRPQVVEHLRVFGAHLQWHGALMLDYLFDPATGEPSYIEANPRIGETVNATLNGVNLCRILAEVAHEGRFATCLTTTVQSETGRLQTCPTISDSRSVSPSCGVRSHSLVMGLMALAQQGAGRRSLVVELLRRCTSAGVYRGSFEELTRPGTDWPSILPGVILVLSLLCRPRLAERIVTRTVTDYGLSAAAVDRIRKLGV
jgi:hypothetical protein